jgi:hypothetical protein
MGFKWTESDWSVHQRSTTDGCSISATSVDDILLASSSKEESNQAAKDISQVFETSHAEDVEHLLGCRIIRWRSWCSLKLDQEVFTTAILREFGIEHLKPNSTPFPVKTYLTANMCPKTDEE